MKTAKEIILEKAGELFCMVHSTTCGKIVEGMEKYAEQFKERTDFPLAVDTLSKCQKPFYYDEGSQFIFSKEGKMIIDIRGWGWIQKLDKGQERQDEIGAMFTEFLNKNV